MNASPELGQLISRLQQQALDPLGGGAGADIAERIRVQQAAAGLASGNQAAYQESALVAGEAQNRRLSAAGQLQSLGGTFLQQLGLASPIVADLGALGQTQLAGQTLAAVTAAGQAQSQIAQQLFSQISMQQRAAQISAQQQSAQQASQLYQSNQAVYDALYPDLTNNTTSLQTAGLPTVNTTGEASRAASQNQLDAAARQDVQRLRALAAQQGNTNLVEYYDNLLRNM